MSTLRHQLKGEESIPNPQFRCIPECRRQHSQVILVYKETSRYVVHKTFGTVFWIIIRFSNEDENEKRI